MIAFFDTSAIVPLIIEEPGTALCHRAWMSADSVVCTQLAFVETMAALARAARLGRMTTTQRNAGQGRLEELWSQLNAMTVDDALIREAATLTFSLALRGYDAVHCAAALRLAERDVVAVSGDRDLLAAWQTSGLAIIDTQAA